MNWLILVQIVVSIALIFLVLIQSQGTGLGRAWGGMSGQYRSKKGLEKSLFALTIALGVLFAVVSILNILL